MKDPTLYVPSHAGIWTNRKFIRLTRRLATNELVAFACLHALWHAVLQQSPDGILDGWDAIDIATAARWPGDADSFVDALVAEGWATRVDGVVAMHEWEEYGGAGATIRVGNKARKREERARAAASIAVARDVTTPTTTKPVVGHAMSRDVTVTTPGPSRDVTVTPPHLSRDVTPDRDRIGSGSDRDRIGNVNGGDPEPVAAAPPAPPRPIEFNRAEPLGPYGETIPKTVEGILEHVVDGETLAVRWLREHPHLGMEGIRRGVGAALAYRVTLDGARFRAWWWPAGFISKADTWLRRNTRELLDVMAAEGRAAKAGAAIATATPDAKTVRRRKLIAHWEAMTDANRPAFPDWLRAAEADGTADKILRGLHRIGEHVVPAAEVQGLLRGALSSAAGARVKTNARDGPDVDASALAGEG